MKNSQTCPTCGHDLAFLTVHYYRRPIHYLAWLTHHDRVVGYLRSDHTIHWTN